MTLYISNRDGNGKTDEQGHYRLPSIITTGTALLPGLAVTQNSPLGLSVLVAAGDYRIDTGNGYAYHGWNNTSTAVALSTADSANPRIDSIVIYVDKGAATSASPPNNPGIAKLIKVNGTPTAIPAAPSAGTIQTAVGAGNPYIVLANVLVGASVTQIVNANITDMRVRLSLADSMVTTNSLLDNIITTNKVVDLSITTQKIADNSVSTVKIQDQAISNIKLANGSVVLNAIKATAAEAAYNASSYVTVPGMSTTFTTTKANQTVVVLAAMQTYRGGAFQWRMLLDGGVVGNIMKINNIEKNQTTTGQDVFFDFFVVPAAGSHTVVVQAMSGSGTTLRIINGEGQGRMAVIGA